MTRRDESDEELRDIVERASGADVEAFGLIYDRFVDDVYRFALFRLGNRHDAEDVTELTFVRAFEAIGRYRWGKAPFSAWLFRIARNLVTDHFRRKGRTTTVDIAEIGDTIPSTRGTYEEVALRCDARELHDAIGKLTEHQRSVVLMKFFGGLTNAEIAAAIGKNEGSVKSLQHRALAALARILAPDEET